MKLSIITINRNNAEGLRKTMESVFKQTYSDFEYIIIDGASTDESINIIKQLNARLTSDVSNVQFTWISEPDTGVFNAMNKGIEMAKGDYLLFLNSGDFLVDVHVLASVFSQERNADILCGKCDVSENGKVIWTSTPPEIVTFGTLYTVGLAHQSTFIKRSLFKTLGLYREDFKYNSDIEFWYRAIILNGATTEKLDVIISNYNLDGISSKEHQTEQYKSEIKEILSIANFDKFIPDYNAWKMEKRSMEMFYWAKRNKGLNVLIKMVYKLAVLRNKKNRK